MVLSKEEEILRLGTIQQGKRESVGERSYLDCLRLVLQNQFKLQTRKKNIFIFLTYPGRSPEKGLYEVDLPKQECKLKGMAIGRTK